MLPINDVFIVIERERDFQDARNKPSGVPGTILLLEEYVNRAKIEFVEQDNTRAALQQIAKIAAIAVRLLETATDSEILLKYGIR